MIRFTTGNLLDAEVDAIVNTVNTVGVMGKGIALMFKERFPENFKVYASSCKRGEVETGRMFVTASTELNGPRWIINFPTKRHWRNKTEMEWVKQGLIDLRRVIKEKDIHSIAIPPLGCGNGGLDWNQVRVLIENMLGDMTDVEVLVYEPTKKYQNVRKMRGVEKLTPARVLIVEMVRRYGVLGFECSILEIQKLAWFLQRVIEREHMENPLNLKFKADRYGPYADNLRHLLDSLDGSYLHCDRRLSDASPSDTIRFDGDMETRVQEYLSSADAHSFAEAINQTDKLIDGFQSPLGMEALATIDWLIVREHSPATLEGIRDGLRQWPGGENASARKQHLFKDHLINAAIKRLKPWYSQSRTK